MRDAAYAERKIREYLSTGRAQVPWKHHPKEVRDELRRVGMRPLLKQCFMNSQKFVLETELDVTYHEGWAHSVIPIEHAWLEHNGEVLDLTIYDNTDVEYLASNVYTRWEILQSVRNTACWTVIDQRALSEIGPWHKQFEELNRLNQQLKDTGT